MANQNGLMLNSLFSMLLKKIIVPTEFHEQVAVVKDMLKDDMSGLVDSLTDFAVDSANVNFNIETNNANFTKVMRKWLNELNVKYRGKIPSGIKPLAKEYFKERWKYSSFPVLKIQKWEEIDGVVLPTQMYFVDGGSIYAKDKDEKNNTLSLFNYDYYLGKDENYLLDKNAIFAKTNGRWFTKYPTPFIIKRGIYHNWKIIESLKDKQTTILDQIIPYLLLVKKGTEGLATSGVKQGYSDTELKAVIKDFQNLMNEIRSGNLDNPQIKTPIRAVNFDEDLSHIIPDMKTIFNKELFVVAERNILAGLGFIDVVEATSTSRRESILNPKVFIEEITTGVEDFKQILKDLILMIAEKNKRHKKWINGDFYITASPIKAFMTDDFKEKIRQLYDRGRISSQTAVELIAEVDFKTEVYRRDKETKNEIETKMYPPIIKNQESQGIDIPGEDIDEDTVSDDKKGIEKENYDMSKKEDLEIAPYNKISDLPASIRKNLSPGLQRTFMSVFNRALRQYKDETKAFKTAWSVIKKIAKKDKSRKWVRTARLTKATLITCLEEIEQEEINETFNEKK